MKKRAILILITTLMCAMLAGCGDNNQQQAALRDQAIALMEAGDYEGAIATLDQALGMSIGQVNGLEIDINYYKAAALVESGRYDEAINCYSNLIKYDDSNYQAYFLRGSVYAKLGDAVSMVDDYNRALTLRRRDYELYIKIYENLDALDMREQGLAFLNTALELSDHSAESYYYKGRIYYLLEQYDSALDMLNTAMDKDVIEAKLYAAKVYQAIGDELTAQKLLLEYAASEEISAEALASLGDIEMNNGNYEVALEYFNAGLNIEGDESRGKLLKGQVIALEHLGRFAEAREILAAYVEEYPDDAEAASEQIFLSTR